MLSSPLEVIVSNSNVLVALIQTPSALTHVIGKTV
jgi:hypothetical protein